MGQFWNSGDLELGDYGRLDDWFVRTRLVVLHAKPDGQRQEAQEEIVTDCKHFPPAQSSPSRELSILTERNPCHCVLSCGKLDSKAVAFPPQLSGRRPSARMCWLSATPSSWHLFTRLS